MAAVAFVSVFLLNDLRPRQPNLPAYKYGQSPSANYHPGGSDCAPTTLTAITDGRKATTERDRCSQAAEDYRLKGDDLVQQTRAADAAHEQTLLTYLLAKMGVWGTIGGLLTFVAAALAAYYARKGWLTGAGHLEHAKSESRPYLLFAQPEVSQNYVAGGYRIWTISFRLINGGQRPALLTSCLIAHDYREPGTANYETLDFQSTGQEKLVVGKDGDMVCSTDVSEGTVFPEGTPTHVNVHKAVIAMVKVVYRGVSDDDDVVYESEQGRVVSFFREAGNNLRVGFALNFRHDKIT